MAYNFSGVKESLKATEAWLAGEFSGLRTGRVSPAILDSVSVESYGARMPIAHVAAVSIEDAKTLRIAPWDAAMVKEIEHAIQAANLGVSVVPDSAGIRVSFPDLTEERRKSLIKIVKTKLEEARIRVRQERDKTMNDIQAKEKDGEIGEDDKFRLKEEMQKLVDEANSKLDAVADKKEKEIMN
ncbi:MAG: ribosome recycling factor [bacterium]|nr:ribosome recycling factor [bacterium]